MKPFAILTFTVAMLLAACTPDPVPPGQPTVQPVLGDGALITVDGMRLPMRSWLPDGKPKAIVVGVHGFNDYSNAFAMPAKFLSAHGIAVYAYDQRGFGAAPDTGRWFGIKIMVEDLDAMVGLIAAHHPNVPVYLLGESMGGAVVMVAMTSPDPPPVAGVILAAPAVWARKRMNVIERVALWLSSHTLPWLPVNGSGLDIVPSDNVEMLRALSRDPLVIKDTRIDTLDGLVNLMDAAYAAAPSMRGPALMLYGEHDEIVPPRPSYDVMAELAAKPRIACAVYAKGYHMLLRDLDADLVDNDVLSWIEHPDAPLPSGADQRATTMLAERRVGRMTETARNPG